MSYRETVVGPGPKKLLALDGGGIRGVITLEVLSEIERMLRKELGHNDDFVLADYFDYIAGTSTGAIIAAGLALGWPVERLRALYATNGKDMFDKAFIVHRYRYKYDSSRLSAMLKREFGATTLLGGAQLRTLLMMVLRNATTDSPWPLSSNPRAKYNDPMRADNNLQLPLWQLVRASTAAPVYFPPEVVTVGPKDFIFVDGGLTVYNNPSFQLFLMATHGAYRLDWQVGEQNLLLVSIGTGSASAANAYLQPGDMNLVYNVSSIPGALMHAAATEQDLLCRIFGRCRYGAALDRELGDMQSGPGILDPRLFTYLRYDADVSREGLDALGLSDIRPEHVQRLDSVDYIGELRRTGVKLAHQVSRAHFAGFLHEA
ncbi:patatin-like phospholipase family protein [Arthrobacter sp. A5]|uniref:patatin-like phospholipase family protein n=1 Tax=Arthrobacter sp. A5 TaxID=576926 RepID=UPI003DAA136A